MFVKTKDKKEMEWKKNKSINKLNKETEIEIKYLIMVVDYPLEFLIPS